MGFLDHQGESEFPFAKETVFNAMLEAIPAVKGMKVENADKLQGRIIVKAGVSLTSWGENIPISLIEVTENRTQVRITSSPKTGIMFGGAVDFGKNRKNIEQILSITSQILSNLDTQEDKASSESSNSFQEPENNKQYERYSTPKPDRKWWKIIIGIIIGTIIVSKTSIDFSVIIGFLSIASVIALIIGIVNPKKILLWVKVPTRLKVIGYWVLAILLLTCISMIIPTTSKKEDSITQSANNINNYAIVKTEPSEPYKCLIYVELDERLDKGELEKIASDIKAKYSQYDKLFIFYNIKGEANNIQAWATTHYKPELEMKINGNKKNEENELIGNAESENSIGRWFCSYTGLNYIIDIEESNNTYSATLQFQNGSTQKDKLIKKNNQFNIVGNQHNEYYILNKNDELEIWDSEGLITTAKKIE